MGAGNRTQFSARAALISLQPQIAVFLLFTQTLLLLGKHDDFTMENKIFLQLRSNFSKTLRFFHLFILCACVSWCACAQQRTLTCKSQFSPGIKVRSPRLARSPRLLNKLAWSQALILYTKISTFVSVLINGKIMCTK
jgi:hypothetical protein